MAGVTQKLKVRMLELFFQAGTAPSLYAALCTAATAPTADTNTLGQLTQIAVGSGYVDGGWALTRNSTTFHDLTEDDANDKATVLLDTLIEASGGPLPASGDGASWLVITGGGATVANREVLAYFDLTSPRTVSDGQQLILDDFEIDLTESV